MTFRTLSWITGNCILLPVAQGRSATVFWFFTVRIFCMIEYLLRYCQLAIATFLFSLLVLLSKSDHFNDYVYKTEQGRNSQY